jgi:OmpA-OmpF porin, OOP family
MKKLANMKKMFLLLTAATVSLAAFAQDPDEEGCKDHPLFTRMQKFRIGSCISNYNAVPVRFAAEKTEEKEGNVTKIGYSFNPANEQEKPPSPLQVIKNYENAILKNGGKKIYSSITEGPQGASFLLTAKEKTYYVVIDNMTPGRDDVCDGYELIIVEIEPMKQEIAATEMFDKLTKEGSVALYINFETGKADVKSESQATVQQIAEMMKANPALKVSIEGHTDNVGTPSANKALSEARAKAVMKAVIAAGIDASRLTAKGWGQEKPVADNKTEEGKAKNRRVEIVKM